MFYFRSPATFYYSNSVPQHKDLNRKIWVNLEDYVLHKETENKDLKVCVFTGPVLSSNDPEFVTKVNDTYIKIPRLFWKIIVYPKSDGKLYRVGFMMSQESLMKFHNAIDSYTDNRSKELVLREIDIDPDLESYSVEQYLSYSIENIVL
ncbi:DNA/RNA non-specific endonuclease [Aquimarina sediminis]|uniref:DNA/RNA non-specific endonuclease n=1 Tax=Aquimarina sediminis TaxID=2070536 RepID=UPI0021CE5B2B|nr:DNA/RNA non-specific endonuclease [Aquimarina sediminis]